MSEPIEQVRCEEAYQLNAKCIICSTPKDAFQMGHEQGWLACHDELIDEAMESLRREGYLAALVDVTKLLCSRCRRGDYVYLWDEASQWQHNGMSEKSGFECDAGGVHNLIVQAKAESGASET